MSIYNDNNDNNYKINSVYTSNYLINKHKKQLSLSLVLTVFAGHVCAAPEFQDVTQAAGISHVMTATLDSYTGGGAAWVDIDNDGYDDLFVPNAEKGKTGWLYHNNQQGGFVEIAAAAGLEDIDSSGMGVAIGDFDGDGFDDIFVAHGSNYFQAPFLGAERNTLYKNNGDNTFTDVTVAANLHNELANSMVASFGDIDADGDLDLYVGNYLLQGRMSIAAGDDRCTENHFYLNNGDGTFSEMGNQLGVDNAGCTLGTIMTNLPAEGSGVFFFNFPDTFYRNDGVDDQGVPVFSADTASNLKDTGNGMGITVGDYDNDGDFDYYTASFTNSNIHSTLNQSQQSASGFATFADKTIEAGLIVAPTQQELDSNFGGAKIAWGVSFFDADNDGFVDLYKANGCINGGCQASDFSGGQFGGIFAAQNQPNRLFLNNHNGAFNDVAEQAGVKGGVAAEDVLLVCPWNAQPNVSFPCFDQSRSVIMSDYDNDGDVDLFVLNGGDNPPAAQQLSLRLKGINGNHRAIGARVRVHSGAGINALTQLREVSSGSGHGSTSSFTLNVGLGYNTFANQVHVYWPSGCIQAVGRLPAGFHTITENCSDAHQIVGRITWNGTGVPDATIWDALRFPQSVTTTDAGGFFVLSGYQQGDLAFLNANSTRDEFVLELGAGIFQVGGGDLVDNEIKLSLKDGYIAGYMNLDTGAPLADTQIWDALTLWGSLVQGSRFSLIPTVEVI